MGSWGELDARYDKLTPALVLLLSVSYMAESDGILQDEEGSALLAVIKKRGLGLMRYEELLERGAQYYQQTSLDDFLKEAAPLLNTEQKLCVLTNIAETSLADGVVVNEENQTFAAFLRAFGLTLEQVQPYLKGVAVKNNLAVFNQ